MRGKLNPMVAFTAGEIEVKGNLRALMALMQTL
jgi:putative sterol carrier protein